jgi:DNA-directed RNA polymerase specialized sigma subunit
METSREVIAANYNRSNSLLRIAKACGISREAVVQLSDWEREDLILSTLAQRRDERKRLKAEIRKLEQEIDMLRQTSIFDFLKIHHEEIKAQKERSDLDDNG